MYGSLPIAEKKGYTLIGWYTNKIGGTKINAKDKFSLTSNQTLYAHWTENTYNISFKANGGKGKMSAQKGILYTKAFKLKANKFKRKGYKFVGWNTKKNGKGISYKNKKSVSMLTNTNGKTVKLYAQWKKKK